ncbi:hypothetical protein ACJMK2_031600 [Sinanodonta woodiana]|uniref:Uncharacterized protein n=1 Tax=Sinanodonta woodiana TaxID=1069815 RepID=A0ABD3WZB0_SINWO
MDSEENATSCSVCREIYSDPRSLPCGHSFCLKCLEGVAGNNRRFPCPVCRFDVDLRYTKVDDLPKNYVLCNVIEALYKKHPSMCLDHNKSLDLFCQGCDLVICSKCSTMKHRRHDIEDIEQIYIERYKELGACQESTKRLASMTQDKSDAVQKSRIITENNIDSIRKIVENTFKKWNDALQNQHDAIFSYLHQERDQRRHVFFEAERILAGSMTTVTGLDTKINKLRNKGAVLVVQVLVHLLWITWSNRLEDTERKIVQDIETCFTPPDSLEIEVSAPWIDEAISNIKLIDMKQTQAKRGQQKIAEIKEENIIMKRLRIIH